MKRFNTTGVCINKKHYMVDIENKLEKIIKLINNDYYFVINRPRQYGKTTTIYMIEQKLKKDYIVISISFEGFGDKLFSDEELFSKEIITLFANSIEFEYEKESEYLITLKEDTKSLSDLSRVITKFIKSIDKEVILIIDEIDKSSNNQVFLSFLGLLRSKYLFREMGKDVSFKSVILSGVYDIKNLKLKIRDNDEKYNSPWNIAVNFDVDMSFNKNEIKSMLDNYKEDKNISMNTEVLSEEIYKFSGGYPFLVSRICQIIDENLKSSKFIIENESNETTMNWEINDVIKSVKILVEESNTLFDDLIKNIEKYKELYQFLYNILIVNMTYTFNINSKIINLGYTLGYLIKDENNNVCVSNQIIKEVIYNYLISSNDYKEQMEGYNFKYNFITKDSGLDMEKVLLKFSQFMKENYNSKDKEFLERHGVLLFLSFIKPIINGIGFDYKEVQISEEKRIDIVIQYNNFKYIIETKIWHGEVAHKKGINQLVDYLNIQNIEKGYLLIFNFNKNKEYKTDRYFVEGKEIFEVIV